MHQLYCTHWCRKFLLWYVVYTLYDTQKTSNSVIMRPQQTDNSVHAGKSQPRGGFPHPVPKGLQHYTYKFSLGSNRNNLSGGPSMFPIINNVLHSEKDTITWSATSCKKRGKNVEKLVVKQNTTNAKHNAMKSAERISSTHQTLAM